MIEMDIEIEREKSISFRLVLSPISVVHGRNLILLLLFDATHNLLFILCIYIYMQKKDDLVIFFYILCIDHCQSTKQKGKRMLQSHLINECIFTLNQHLDICIDKQRKRETLAFVMKHVIRLIKHVDQQQQQRGDSQSNYLLVIQYQHLFFL